MAGVEQKNKPKKTPNYFHCIEDKRLRDSVYEPEADTFVFLDGLDKDEPFLVSRFPKSVDSDTHADGGDAVVAKTHKSRRRRYVEIGCGSGTVISHLESILGWSPGDEYHVVDVNPIALEAASMTWEKSVADAATETGKPRLWVHLGDLFSPFVEPVVDAGSSDVARGEQQPVFDVVLFNPPYVPTSSEELSKAIEGGDMITAAWCGGPRGRVVVDRFLKLLPKFLNPDGGVAYVIAIKENDVADMIRFVLEDCDFEEGGVEASVVFHRYTSEDLYLLKITRRGK